MRRTLSVLLTVFASTSGVAAPPEVEAIEARAAALRPRATEMRWQAIPWVTDLPKAVRTADEEGRPVLVWASGDEPLERC